ncbi:MAG: SDR family oxidoreductase [Planctomycetota bacterium]
MAIFLTGATGYLGSYLTDRLLRAGETLTVLVRAGDADHARQRLWKALQLHLPANTLAGHLGEGRLRFLRGDLTAPRLGLTPAEHARLVDEHSTVVHAAATLNRRSSRACFDVNLRGGLNVIQLARAIHEAGRLRRYAHVSTVAIAGKRQGELVGEDEALGWERSDWDPYARTKKFGEHLIDELLPDASVVIGRPSIVLGDARFPQTTQFDMARAFAVLARLPALPFRPEWRLDIVNVDFVADALADLIRKEAPRHRVYHLSAGAAAPTFAEITDALAREGVTRRPPRYLPRLGGPVARAVHSLSNARRLGPVAGAAALLDVFWPYLEWDVVFDHRRVVEETARAPQPFPRRGGALLRWCEAQGFRYPYRGLPPVLADVDAGDWQLAEPAAAGRGCRA